MEPGTDSVSYSAFPEPSLIFFLKDVVSDEPNIPFEISSSLQIEVLSSRERKRLQRNVSVY